MSMFVDQPGEEREDYPEMDEFPEKQLIAFEKGNDRILYLTAPPLTLSGGNQEVYRFRYSALPELQNGAEVRVCGLVSALKEITTKKGDRMAFLTLEDMKGFVEVILFPEVFKAALPCLRGGDPLLVSGILDLSEEHSQNKGHGGSLSSRVDPLTRETLPFENSTPPVSLVPARRFKRDYSGEPGVL